MLKDRIESDLKSAMLSGNNAVADTLKMVKSAVLYKEVELGSREQGLTDEQVIQVLSKEAKKRQEAAAMYEKAGRTEQANAEQSEYEIIAAYLPAQMDDGELEALVTEVIGSYPDASMKDMGKIIGEIKTKAGANADGGRIAQLVKQKLS